jgi:hypothetical protein
MPHDVALAGNLRVLSHDWRDRHRAVSGISETPLAPAPHSVSAFNSRRRPRLAEGSDRVASDYADAAIGTLYAGIHETMTLIIARQLSLG